MTMADIDALVSHIKDGATLCIPVTRSGIAITATRRLIARGVKNLHLIAIPTSGLQADLLIGAGAVSVMESAGVTLDEFGQAPRFVAAVKEGSIHLKDSTCPAIISALQAGEKGIPFIPMRGLIGSDLLKYRKDYHVIDNPMSPDPDPIVTLPAIVPDVALFHTPLGDTAGNVWIGNMRELMTMAHAAKTTLVTVEAITDENLLADPLRSPATIPASYISGIAKAENGAWPLGLSGCYDTDTEALSAYAKLARTQAGFQTFLDNPSLQAAE